MPLSKATDNYKTPLLSHLRVKGLAQEPRSGSLATVEKLKPTTFCSLAQYLNYLALTAIACAVFPILECRDS